MRNNIAICLPTPTRTEKLTNNLWIYVCLLDIFLLGIHSTTFFPKMQKGLENIKYNRVKRNYVLQVKNASDMGVYAFYLSTEIVQYTNI